jgi:hypothetical protein
MKSAIVLFVVGMLGVQPTAAQVVETADLWRAFAEKVEVGSAVRVRLHNGQQFIATLVQARPDAVLLQPKTRVAVPVQPVAYDAILSMERIRTGGIGDRCRDRRWRVPRDAAHLRSNSDGMTGWSFCHPDPGHEPRRENRAPVKNLDSCP